ncbi:MAG: hypothetical protein A3J24_02640 [Deltaproteobacteria bacterium RIFCSPLOWO2_02_FULL_53_8]|nr:MAG: hypothetical protein A3J24_02640 [Deltaproteobacteria bacterium RIFCSPLOWO2_02_FULL_53_8]
MARVAGNTYSIAELRASMGDDKASLPQRRKAAKKLHELGLISDDQFDKFRARSAIDSLVGGADRDNCPPEIYEETQDAFAESRRLNPHFGGRTTGMIGRRGTLATIKLMIGRKHTSSDFESLRKHGRLISSFEAIALRHPQYFSDSELAQARKRLEEAGFDVRTITAPASPRQR